MILFIFCFILGKYIDIEPQYLTMTGGYVIAASKENFYLWHYKTPKSHTSIELPGLASFL